MAYAREEIINIYDTLPARYNIGEIEVDPVPIAPGMFGSVHRGWWGDRAVAVKKFDLDNTNHNFNLAAKEMARMIRLRHQNVLNVYGFYFVGEGLVLKCSMVMELMEFDLDKYIEQKYIEQKQGESSLLMGDEGSPLTDDEVVYIIAEIARGMKHVHEKGYAHRDLKPQNVLLRRSAVLTDIHLEVKVADFGSSELMSAGQCDRKAGTLRYKAPEQFDGDVSKLQPLKMDVYSFGCTCFKLWTGKDPPIKNHAGLMELWERRCARKLPGDVEDAITKCLHRTPDARPGFSEISGALDAVLKKRQVQEQVPHREEVTEEEAADRVVRRREVVEKLGLDGGVNGLDYADCVIFPEELVVLRTVGLGYSGIVYEAGWKGTRCALKVFQYAEMADPSWLKMLPTVIHENIVTFFGYSLTREEEEMHPSILMELLAKDLRSYLVDRSTGEEDVYLYEHTQLKIMKGIAEGMKYLHDKDLVHGDLKPANVLVKGTPIDSFDIDTVKLIDFILIPPDEPIYTLRYAAPEVLQARRDRHLWGSVDYKKADVYSFAIICSDILGMDDAYGTGISPRKFREEVIEGILRPTVPCSLSYSEQCLVPLMTSCWSHDPANRPHFAEICSFLSHHMRARECTRSSRPTRVQECTRSSRPTRVQESTRSWSRCTLL